MPRTETQRDDNHAIQNARGWSETITALVAALNADYDRLEELRDERADLMAERDDKSAAAVTRALAVKALERWDEENGEELRGLVEAVTVDGDEMKDADAARERILESALDAQIRSGRYTPGDTPEPEEFAILLTTGGPALRIRGELGEHNEPERAWLEYQDWGTPWTEFHGEGAASQDDLLAFCSVFYFGE
ncbi:MAG: hypothetical protein IVW54_22875 [Candidatus Binataceae bacterium]|nr:hypothetical protein [Candidatus Binataceae bacterium]